jgi:dTDP-4-amino-4,6-dideoxygalactose transaminase
VASVSKLAQKVSQPFTVWFGLVAVEVSPCLLHMFSFNLPETHHLYLLASSFTDFWRRINIYWKDFVMKLFFYPTHFALRKVGPIRAMSVATVVTFIATWLAVSYAEATPLAIEFDPRTYNLNPNRIESVLTPRTKAIIPVHLYGTTSGHGSDLGDRSEIRTEVIEDAAQAQGARYKGRRTGSLGNAAGFSSYPAKNLGAFSDARAITTDDADLANRVLRLRNYGSQQKYYHDLKGFNSRLDELQAAFLRVKLRKLDEWNGRRSIAKLYNSELSTVNSQLVLPFVPNWAEPAWYIFVIRHSRREFIQQKLPEAGIATLIHYPIPPHLSAAYNKGKYSRGTFLLAEELSGTASSLPIGPHVSSDDVRCVVEALNRTIRSL